MSREYPDRPLVGIGTVILRDRRVLLVRRARPPRAGEWSLPGGLQQLGETVFEAAAREVREETGVIVRPLAIIDVVDLIERDPVSMTGPPPGAPLGAPPGSARVRWHYTLVDVLADWVSGEPAAADDAAAAMWAAEPDIDALLPWTETRRIIARARHLQASLPATSGG